MDRDEPIEAPASPPPSSADARPQVLGLAVNIAKTPAGSEDAEPLLWVDEERGVGAIGVFDGMGGAGSVPVEDPETGTRSGAYHASREARALFEAFVREGPPFDPDVRTAAVRLRDHLAEGLKQRAELLQMAPLRLRSRLLKRLPTTMAAARFQIQDEDCLIFHVFWAGDSRVFELCPDHGLVQLTRDDLVSGGDPFENLLEDSPISNHLSADGGFTVHSGTLQGRAPLAVLAATDGCFGYLSSPAHFEFLLLETLAQADSKEDWQSRLASAITGLAGDDATLSLVAAGWPDFPSFQKVFHARLENVRKRYIDPVAEDAPAPVSPDAGAAEPPEETASPGAGQRARNLERLRTLWDDYRQGYLLYLNEREAAALEDSPAPEASALSVSKEREGYAEG